MCTVREYMADLLRYVKKIQNGGCRHVELLFSNLGPPTKSPSWPEVCVKISFQSLYYFERCGYLKLLQIWLKTPITAPSQKINVFGGVWPSDIIFRHRNTQNAHPWANPRRLRYTTIHRENPSIHFYSASA